MYINELVKVYQPSPTTKDRFLQLTIATYQIRIEEKVSGDLVNLSRFSFFRKFGNSGNFLFHVAFLSVII